MGAHTDIQIVSGFIPSFAQNRNRTPIWVRIKKWEFCTGHLCYACVSPHLNWLDSIRCNTKSAGLRVQTSDRLLGGGIMSCATVKSSWRDFENKANGIPASSLPLCRFTGTKYACREKWGEGMWILLGGETKQQTKEDEADSLWRRLLYCKIAAASPSERKKNRFTKMLSHT